MSEQFLVRHKFGGGWATDIGPTIDSAPDGNGLFVIPYLLQAENCFFELDGGPHKEYGTAFLNESAISAHAIKGIYDLWLDADTQHRIVAINDKVYKDDADGSFDQLTTGLVAGAVPNFNAFDDLLIFANDAVADVPKSWDGTTWQNLAGTPPNFSFSVNHVGHVFAAGDKVNKSKLSWCVPFDPEDWTGSGSGDIFIDPNDGDEITGIMSYKQRLLVFKGPNKGSIHLITGTSSDNFAHIPLQTGISCVGQNSLFRMGDDVVFLWSDGHLYSLAATDKFGDFQQASQLTRNISTWISAHYNLSRLKHAWASNWPSRGIALLAVPIDSESDPNFILMVDYRFGEPRLAPWVAFDRFTSLTTVVDTISSRRIIMAGGNDGKVYKLGQPGRGIDGDAINYNVRTPFMNYGDSFTLKTLQSLALGIAPHNNEDYTFEWSRDNEGAQSVTLTQSGGDVLGDADENEFTLDTSTLGGASFVENYIDVENAGQGRSWQFRVSDSTLNADIEVHSLTCIFEIDGPSLEN